MPVYENTSYVATELVVWTSKRRASFCGKAGTPLGLKNILPILGTIAEAYPKEVIKYKTFLIIK